MMTINKNTDPDQYYNRKTTPSNSLPDGPGFKIFISHHSFNISTGN